MEGCQRYGPFLCTLYAGPNYNENSQKAPYGEHVGACRSA